MHVEEWRGKLRHGQGQEVAAMKARLEARVRAGQMGGGLRQLQGIMGRRMRGEMGGAVRWHTSREAVVLRDDRQAHDGRTTVSATDPMRDPAVASLASTAIVHNQPADWSGRSHDYGSGRWRHDQTHHRRVPQNKEQAEAPHHRPHLHQPGHA